MYGYPPFPFLVQKEDSTVCEILKVLLSSKKCGGILDIPHFIDLQPSAVRSKSTNPA